MPSRKKTSKAFKSLKKDKYSKENSKSIGNKVKSVNLAHLLQLQQQQQKNKRSKTALAPVSTSASYSQQMSELEQRRDGKKRQNSKIAEIKIAPATFSFVTQNKPDILFADSLLADEADNEQVTSNAVQENVNKRNQRYFQGLSNRFGGLNNDSDDEEAVPVTMAIQPATFNFPRATEPGPQ
jgi:hypothetical protein